MKDYVKEDEEKEKKETKPAKGAAKVSRACLQAGGFWLTLGRNA